MNTITALLLCFVFVSAGLCMTTEEQEAIHNKCKPQSGVSEDIVMKAKNGEFVDDPKFKAHLVCFTKALGLLNDAGEIQKDATRAALMGMFNDASVADEMMKCAVDKSSPEETTFECMKCMHALKPLI